MSSLAYYLIALAAALLVIAAVSGVIARHMRRAQRRLHAVELLGALARSTEWVAAQGRAICFQAPTQPGDPVRQEIAAVQRQWFPELQAPAQKLTLVHQRLARLLSIHERLRIADPDAWLDGAHDAAFVTLRREHSAIVQAMERQLLAIAGKAGTLRQYTFPASAHCERKGAVYDLGGDGA